LDSVERITLPDNAVFNTHNVSEGVPYSMADIMHLAEFDGTGIKLAVIDDSFFTHNSEISENIVGEWFSPMCPDIACGETDESSHGTAVDKKYFDSLVMRKAHLDRIRVHQKRMKSLGRLGGWGKYSNLLGNL